MFRFAIVLVCVVLITAIFPESAAAEHTMNHLNTRDTIALLAVSIGFFTAIIGFFVTIFFLEPIFGDAGVKFGMTITIIGVIMFLMSFSIASPPE